MGLSEALRLLRQRWAVMLAVVVLCMAVGAALTAAAPRKYQATAQLFVSVVLPNDPAGLAAANTFATARIQSYVTLAASPDVTDAVVKRLSLPMTSAALGKEISAVAPPNRLVVDLQVTDASAGRVAPIANAVAAQFVTAVEGLEQTQNGQRSPVRVTLTRAANPPGGPVSPRVGLNLALSLLAGLLLAVGAARLRDHYDDSLDSVDRLESITGCPVLAVLPRAGRSAGTAAARSAPDPRSQTGRAYAVFMAGLAYIGLDDPPRVLAVTSALVDAGTAVVAVELGAALAAGGDSVCLVDADLRAPALVRLLDLPPAPGLTQVLIGRSGPDTLVQEVGQGLYAVSAGPTPPNPVQLLGSPQAANVVEQVARAFRFTILGSGPVVPHGDGAAAASLADATILVVPARHAHLAELGQAVQRLLSTTTRPVGVILAGASGRSVQRFLRSREALVVDAGRSSTGTAQRRGGL